MAARSLSGRAHTARNPETAAQRTTTPTTTTPTTPTGVGEEDAEGSKEQTEKGKHDNDDGSEETDSE